MQYSHARLDGCQREGSAAVEAQNIQQKILNSYAGLMFCLPAQIFGLVSLVVQMQALDQELQGMQLRCSQRFASLAQACDQTADALQC
jgi:hypothetical protein